MEEIGSEWNGVKIRDRMSAIDACTGTVGELP